MLKTSGLWLALLLIGSGIGDTRLAAEERVENFDADPGWEGHNNRSTAFEKREIVQRFGYSNSQHAGGQHAGEIGGSITPAAEPAYYAKQIAPATFDDRLTASGVLACPGEQPFHALIAFFNSETLNEWRTPNTIAIRIQGRGEMFYAFVEYCTGTWRAGGDSPGGFATVPGENGRRQLRGFKTNGVSHRWSIAYDPAGNQGTGSITVTIDDETALCHLDAGHKQDGATFNRFGILPVMKQWDQPGEVWLDDMTINGAAENFSTDPQWDGFNNHKTYTTSNVRPRFDFGYSPTNFAGGARPGELGGLVFRGDIRYPERMACYGAKTETLSLARPLRAAGTVALRRGVSDSTTLLGFYHARESLKTTDSQATGWPRSFLGVAIEGPSRVGFQLYPAVHDAGDQTGYARNDDLPTILPNGAVHRWTLQYHPPHGTQPGECIVALDGRPVRLELPVSESAAETQFDRFGLITTWIDGNGQQVYFDDLTYTWRQ